jgi:hypothetical protein
MWRRVDLVWTDVSEERVAWVEKSAGEEPAWTGGWSSFLARGFFDAEDGSDTFLRNVGSRKSTRRHILEDGILQ